MAWRVVSMLIVCWLFLPQSVAEPPREVFTAPLCAFCRLHDNNIGCTGSALQMYIAALLGSCCRPRGVKVY